MKLYRFSPIRSQVELLQALEYTHNAAHELCHEATGGYVPTRGNIGIFCHNYEEFTYLTQLCSELTLPTPNYKNKYFLLKQPITFPAHDGIPGATYEYLYVRQVDPYRSQVGDVDFVMSPEVYEEFKGRLNAAEFTDGARLFGRAEEDMIELWLPQYDVISYVASESMHEAIAGTRQDIAGVIVRDAQGRYLLVQEKRADVYGKWNLPAGKIDPGETPEQAAVREAREETGYEVELLGHKPLLEERVESAGRSFYLYGATMAGSERIIDLEETLPIAWKTFKEIQALEVAGNMRTPIICKAIYRAQGVA